MPDHSRQTEFEQKLIQLKQARKSGEISVDQYIAEAQNLRFDDASDNQTWVLDAETGSWWVAPLGTEDFEECVPPEVSTPPDSETESSSDFETENEPEMVTPPADISSEPDPVARASVSEDELGGREDNKNSKYILFGIIVIVLLLGVGTIWFLFFRNDQTSGASPEVIPPSVEAPIGITDTPTATASTTAIPTATNTSTPESSPTATTSPVPQTTSTPFPTATHTPAQPPPALDTPTSTPTQNLTPTLTPTPELIGKIAYPEFDPNTSTFNVNVLDLASNQIIKTITQASQPDLSSDGTKLAFISWAPDNAGLYSISLNDDIRNIISNSREGQRPQWSIDNQAPVFEYIKEEQQDIRFSDNDGVPNIQKGLTPAWSPDGRLVMRVCQDTKCGLAVVRTNGTDLKFLTGSTADISPSVSPDGQWIAYSSEQDDNWDVWLISIEGGTPIRLTNSPGRDGIPTWSPDGNWIAFVSETGGQWTIQAIHPDGTGQQKLQDISNTLDAKVIREEYRQLGWLHESISWSD